MANLRVRSPAYGTVQAVLGYALFYLVVSRATDALAATLAAVAPDASAALLTTALAAVLWVMLGLTLLTELRRQYDAVSPEFVAREEVAAFLAQRRHSRETWMLWGGAALLGGVAVVLARDAFFRVLDDAILTGRRLVESGHVGAFDPTNVALGVAFLVGFGLFATGVDRLLVGALREVQFRRATG